MSPGAQGASRTAHPRSRGENLWPPLGRLRAGGSSPLTRGKLRRRNGQSRWRGLIPAHAGKTPRCRGVDRVRPAHPRSRGENAFAILIILVIFGSSPLTRGKPHPMARQPCRSRLIPAHAGKTGGVWLGCGAYAAHPRSRGENGGRVAGLRGVRGSSPLTRGKRVAGCPQLGADRLIPAHAGKTLAVIASGPGTEAHPRSRGENRLVPCPFSLFGGSSPLTRGKHRRSARTARQRGLIPAHAGKTAHL